jgi:hypothetical protein
MRLSTGRTNPQREFSVWQIVEVVQICDKTGRNLLIRLRTFDSNHGRHSSTCEVKGSFPLERVVSLLWQVLCALHQVRNADRECGHTVCGTLWRGRSSCGRYIDDDGQADQSKGGDDNLAYGSGHGVYCSPRFEKVRIRKVRTATLAGPENSLKFDGRFPHSVRDGGAWTTVNHERMPVLLTREDERRGLTGSTDEALALARGYPPTRSSSR